jgi:hypothetical protein
MIGRIARVVFALAFGASATRARGGGPSVALTFRSARPPRRTRLRLIESSDRMRLAASILRLAASSASGWI